MQDFPKHPDLPSASFWPSLDLPGWRESNATLHMWTQVIGKIRLMQMPHVNHWWQVPLYVTANGLTTALMPHGGRCFQIDFDFLAHKLIVRTGSGEARSLALEPMPVAAFYREVMDMLENLGVPVQILPRPVEVDHAIPFEEDETHRAYDPEYARRLWRTLASAEQVLAWFRSAFIGKCSPVHFFWGGFDLAVSRFSGRPAPEHGPVQNAPLSMVREAYSHEVSSCGFWPGGMTADPAFYAYAYPEPAGFPEYPVEPEEAFYHQELREFLLPYDAMRKSPDPSETLLGFLQSTYAAAADLGRWDRPALEREPMIHRLAAPSGSRGSGSISRL